MFVRATGCLLSGAIFSLPSLGCRRDAFIVAKKKKNIKPPGNTALVHTQRSLNKALGYTVRWLPTCCTHGGEPIKKHLHPLATHYIIAEDQFGC